MHHQASALSVPARRVFELWAVEAGEHIPIIRYPGECLRASQPAPGRTAGRGRLSREAIVTDNGPGLRGADETVGGAPRPETRSVPGVPDRVGLHGVSVFLQQETVADVLLKGFIEPLEVRIPRRIQP